MLDAMARRGKLPGFAAGPGGRDWLFAVDAFASPFDGQVRARVEGAGGAGGTRLRFEVRLKPRWPAVFVMAMLLAIWPGVVLTESLLASFFPHTPWTWVYTWWWYMPLSIVSTPFAIREAMGRSRKGAEASAREVIGELARALGGERHQTPDTRRQTPDTRRQTPDTRRQTPDARLQA